MKRLAWPVNNSTRDEMVERVSMVDGLRIERVA